MKSIFYERGRAWIELDMDALRHNVEALRTLLPPGCELMPAVKADAYGHGAVLIAKELNRLGVEAFCVATAQEGAELRQAKISGVILILGYTHPRDFPLLTHYDLTQTVVDCEYGKILNRTGTPIRVHIGVDTGMRRLGEPCGNVEGISRLFQMENLRVDGIFTHLCADDTENASDRAFTLRQGKAFWSLAAQLRSRGCDIPKAHLLSSYGLLNYPTLGGDYARVGIALYGVLSTRADWRRCGLNLQPVLSLKARISTVRALKLGEGAGYGLAFRAKRDGRIAALSIGYADGLPRALSCGAGSALVNGRTAPIIGRVCMDQTLIDVTGIPDVHAGDTAVLIGTAGDQAISAYDLAEKAGTITNEVLSRMGSRLARVAVGQRRQILCGHPTRFYSQRSESPASGAWAQRPF